jgi:hypothetical protein
MEPGLGSRLNVPENGRRDQRQLELPAWKQELKGYLPVQTLSGDGALCNVILQLVTDQHWGWRITCTSHRWHRELPDDPKSEVRDERQAGQERRVATKQQGPYLYLVTDQH